MYRVAPRCGGRGGGGRCSSGPLGAAASPGLGGGRAGSLPAALWPPLLPSCLLAMAAAASLSPEELLPKGGAGKAEELEDELDEEEEDDEEVSGQAVGKAGRVR